jgi:hypothetical protein
LAPKERPTPSKQTHLSGTLHGITPPRIVWRGSQPQTPTRDAAAPTQGASDLAFYVTGAAVVADWGLTAQTGLPTRIPLP